MTAKSRLSNIELLRIFSMFGVLIVHADFGALGNPTHTELFFTPVFTIMRTFIEAFAIVAVNVFVLISGWFGINYCFNVHSFSLVYGVYAVYVEFGILVG